jgi:hypothetical protein
MTDREQLLVALLEESERRAGAEVSVLDVIAMLERLGAEHQLTAHHPLVQNERRTVCQPPGRAPSSADLGPPRPVFMVRRSAAEVPAVADS